MPRSMSLRVWHSWIQATFHAFGRAVTCAVLYAESFNLEGKMVGAWLPQRASAELSIFPAYGRAVHTLPGWLHFDMETLIIVTLNAAQGHALSSLYWIVPLHLLILCD